MVPTRCSQSAGRKENRDKGQQLLQGQQVYQISQTKRQDSRQAILQSFRYCQRRNIRIRYVGHTSIIVTDIHANKAINKDKPHSGSDRHIFQSGVCFYLYLMKLLSSCGLYTWVGHHHNSCFTIRIGLITSWCSVIRFRLCDVKII